MAAVMMLINLLVASMLGVGSANTSHEPAVPATSRLVAPAMEDQGLSRPVFDGKATASRVRYQLDRPVTHSREPQRRFTVVYRLHDSGGGLPGESIRVNRPGRS